MDKKWTIVEVLRHARHDWLNQLQLIQGYITLNKLDRVKELINEIVARAQEDSKLSNLQLPRVAERLITHNWEPHAFQISYEIHAKANEISISDEWLDQWIDAFFQMLDCELSKDVENILHLTLHTFKEAITFTFRLTGRMEEPHRIKTWLEENAKGHIKHIEIFHVDTQLLSFKLCL
ncbi:Spo0B domain-containing protein [Aeribacillus pallidus]|jgi:stage 0 sporulation protein B (sporulation initiation phosphotransferase)|uniref:Spo0B domain-containing protein n=1 Tax=Aeribacillus pallidus TaxID=33936 RepID=UPI003D195B99